MTEARRRPRAAAVVLAGLLGLGLAACSPAQSSPGAGEPATTSTPPAADPSPSASVSSSAPQEAGTAIRITIDGHTLTATVWDNPAGRDLVERLPVTLTFEDLNGVEKIAPLDDPLTMDQMPEGDDPEIGDLGYYAPWSNIVLYYGDVSYWNGIARIGRIHGDLSPISEQTGSFTATLERAD